MGGGDMGNKGQFFPKIFFSTPTHAEQKTKCLFMISMKPSTKIVNFMTTAGLWAQSLGRGQYGHIAKMF